MDGLALGLAMGSQQDPWGWLWGHSSTHRWPGTGAAYGVTAGPLGLAIGSQQYPWMGWQWVWLWWHSSTSSTHGWSGTGAMVAQQLWWHSSTHGPGAVGAGYGAEQDGHAQGAGDRPWHAAPSPALRWQPGSWPWPAVSSRHPSPSPGAAGGPGAARCHRGDGEGMAAVRCHKFKYFLFLFITDNFLSFSIIVLSLFT